MSKRPLKSSDGFTMIELGMVLIILSVVIGPIFTYASAQRDRTNYWTTIDKQRKIADALSIYAQKYGYLPCPASPTHITGFTGGLGDARIDCHSTSNTAAARRKRHGLVPFRTLGLSQNDVIDGYGNMFTYVVSVYANNIPCNNPQLTCNASTRLKIYPACYGNASSLIPLYQKWARNKRKAYFCCRHATQHDGSGNNIGLIVQENFIRNNMQYGGTTRGYLMDEDNLNAIPDGSNVQENISYVAYVLISHGKNGEGAYILNRPDKKPWRTAGLQERGNGDGESLWYYYSMEPVTKSGDDYFDDIVLWRTQEQTMSETGNNTCMSP